ncbi:MAG: DUF4393 domain-containing protein [Betaproteobacteria bacterium]|nr:DUF4393 domain-containing protein [Betaproteobacteria bacterium]
MDPTNEQARAVRAVADAAKQAIQAGQQLGSFISRYIGGPLEQGIGIWEDKLRYLRWERQIRFMTQADKYIKLCGLPRPDRAVPLKIALPIFQAASIEEDDGLQDRWAILLANAGNSSSGIDVQRAFVSILEEISPLQAKILDLIYDLPFDAARHEGIWIIDLPHSVRIATTDDKRLSRAENSLPDLADDIKIALADLDRLGCLRVARSIGGGEVFISVNPTLLGAKFVQACRLQASARCGSGS